MTDASALKRHTTARIWLGPLLALAALSPAPGQANDRDLQGTTVPAAACEVRTSQNVVGDTFSFGGVFFVEKSGGNPNYVSLVLRCPLPLNNVALSSSSNSNKISKIRVTYIDNDGLSPGAGVVVRLQQTTPTSSYYNMVTVCDWFSDTNGTGSTGGTAATFACPHNLVNGAFYWFEVVLGLGQSTTTPILSAMLLGIDFP
jgi:hypothetical protein